MSNTNETNNEKIYANLTLQKMQENPQLLEKMKGLTAAQKKMLLENVGRRMIAKAQMDEKLKKQ